MSGFVQQHHTVDAFSSSDSWVILSETEISIKRKIEKVGTPLRDWDIQIFRGVLTGFNNAFIITSEKRNEILSNCLSDEEKARTAELIRPILRGRDIKRYGYDWADLWLINTHNGVRGVKPRINIEDYPAVKHHLDEYWDQLKKRSDKGDTPYNLRNCAYLDDFFKPKIIFQEIVQESQFLLDTDKGFFCNDTGRIIVGQDIDFLIGMLNSKLFFFAVKHYYGGGVLGEHGIRMKHTFFGNFPCVARVEKIAELAALQSESYSEERQQEIDTIIYDCYNLTPEERLFIDSQ